MRRIGPVIAVALAAAALPAAAQDWPTRPVTMVIPFAPGGALDVVARIVGPRLSELPKGTPTAIVQKLNDAASATIDTPSVRERLREIGVSTVARERRSPEYLQRFVGAEIEKWAVPIRSAGVTAE